MENVTYFQAVKQQEREADRKLSTYDLLTGTSLSKFNKTATLLDFVLYAGEASRPIYRTGLSVPEITPRQIEWYLLDTIKLQRDAGREFWLLSFERSALLCSKLAGFCSS